MAYIYSTMTSSVTYHQYQPVKDEKELEEELRKGVRRPVRSVTINGGANVSNKFFETPRGVVTQVSAEELEFLKTDPTFKLHEKNKFVSIDYVKVVDTDRYVEDKDLAPKDLSAPKDDKYYEDINKKSGVKIKPKILK